MNLSYPQIFLQFSKQFLLELHNIAEILTEANLIKFTAC